MAAKKTLTDAERAQRENERKAKFKELAGKRLANAQKAIALIGNLASYKPSETQVKFLADSLSTTCQQTFSRFQAGAKSVQSVEIPD